MKENLSIERDFLDNITKKTTVPISEEKTSYDKIRIDLQKKIYRHLAAYKQIFFDSTLQNRLMDKYHTPYFNVF